MKFIILGTLLGASYLNEPERLIILLGFLEEVFVFFFHGAMDRNQFKQLV